MLAEMDLGRMTASGQNPTLCCPFLVETSHVKWVKRTGVTQVQQVTGLMFTLRGRIFWTSHIATVVGID